ncbi:hypothetical protein [Streptomyces xantholiticus]|uniref:Uncharacterized protein n=1 Tax=Streptomyces xantholiticus TaxID=68285 RepID=A0ABV1V1E7_9ACTN
MSVSSEPEQAPPWRPEDGPPPAVWTWPPGDRPGLFVRAGGRWRYASVIARHVHDDGRESVQVAVDADGSTTVSVRSYWWPQDGLKAAHASAVEPVTGRGRHASAGMPTAPPR